MKNNDFVTWQDKKSEELQVLKTTAFDWYTQKVYAETWLYGDPDIVSTGIPELMRTMRHRRLKAAHMLGTSLFRHAVPIHSIKWDFRGPEGEKANLELTQPRAAKDSLDVQRGYVKIWGGKTEKMTTELTIIARLGGARFNVLGVDIKRWGEFDYGKDPGATILHWLKAADINQRGRMDVAIYAP